MNRRQHLMNRATPVRTKIFLLWCGLLLFQFQIHWTRVPLFAQDIPRIVPQEPRNHWPSEWESEFQERGQRVLQAQCAANRAAGLGGRTYFENEKRAYGYLLAHVVAGDRDTAIAELQREDAQAKEWHSATAGIDYYACFTLKHQIRKYFLCGELFAPEYKSRMFAGAKAWTAQDPLNRPHPAFKGNGPGWGPDARNSWVDIRNTENLFLMRVSAVYLMAEETGNAQTRDQYKKILLGYAHALYRVGMGEWDSENYHGHSLSPLLNLYDFAKDQEVRAAAKACLDYMCAIGAVKYYRGAFNGPGNRDYNHAQPFGGSAANMLWLYFGDTPLANTRFESDEVHALTSGYRPPAAVVHLARKNFPKPVEILASKPVYTASTKPDLTSPPESFETHFFGRTYQFGSLVNGTSPGQTATNGWKILLADEKRGALAIQGVPGPDPRFAGSARYERGKVAGENRCAQYRNVGLWLAQPGDAPWVWLFPDSIQVEAQGGVTFLRGEQTWIALRPIHLSQPAVDKKWTQQLLADEKEGASWAGHHIVAAKGQGGEYCGIAVEIGEAPDHADYAAFVRAVLATSRVDLSGLADGVVEYTGSQGQTVKLAFDAVVQETGVWRNDQRHDWADHAKYVYQTVTEKDNARDSAPLIEQEWLGGKLTIRAGGEIFVGEVK
ncbi:MAG: hypothetical protein SFX18_09720 [Pirellulales bacterium]|nr:hypothetical protein [Pirellulales bacterium]